MASRAGRLVLIDLQGKKSRPANLLAVQNKAFGVLQMTLHADSYVYAWTGLATDRAFRDAGSVPCS